MLGLMLGGMGVPVRKMSVCVEHRCRNRVLRSSSSAVKLPRLAPRDWGAPIRAKGDIADAPSSRAAVVCIRCHALRPAFAGVRHESCRDAAAQQAKAYAHLILSAYAKLRFNQSIGARRQLRHRYASGLLQDIAKQGANDPFSISCMVLVGHHVFFCSAGGIPRPDASPLIDLSHNRIQAWRSDDISS